ncbi:ABC transporter permease [Kordia sp. YSTF-M3]|uniref:ABC transporter permease n=1 Tax=Kordia aestuariivivens TaxID=2759037 RepID=A0ABR7QER7_9FLAO|nr:ABC transporter permease [Kordia aestuariivivens]MBC8757066.1 ABC transporter permease [Kordia aestuariivivens]
MLKNYIKIAWRTLFKNKYFALINMTGLGIGIAACLFIVQYVFFESDFDTFHKESDLIYRVTHSRQENNVLVENSAMNFSAIGPTIKQDIPEVEVATSLEKQDCIISAENSYGDIISYKENEVYFVDENFLDVFTFPIISGVKEALKQPNSIMLTQSLARKLFGEEDPVGKTMKIVNFNQGVNLELVIRAILEDVPENSHLKFTCLVTTVDKPNSWRFIDKYAYVKFFPGTKVKNATSKLPAYVNKYLGNNSDGVTNIQLAFQPVETIHLYSDLTKEISVNGNGKFVWFMLLIAALILIIAYVNYINLSTIKSMDRAKEVGLRRTFGSQKGALIMQFFFESLILSFIGIFIAIILVLIFRTGFEGLTGVTVTTFFWTDYKIWLPLLALLILGSFLSSLYPAYLLSSYNPVQILKGKLPIGSSGTFVRKCLVVFQFIISISLIIGTFTIYKQLEYMQKKDIGINMERNIVVPAPSNNFESQMGGRNFYQKMQSFRANLLEYPDIEGVASASAIPGIDLNWRRPYKRKNAINKNSLYATFSISPEFIDQFEIGTVAGKVFNSSMMSINEMPTGNTPILINEAGVNAFGFESAEKAIGEFITDTNGSGMEFEYEIIGVIKNFNQKSLKETLTPIVFRLEDGSSIEYYTIKVASQNVSSSIARIEESFKQNFPVSPFEYFFLEEFFNEQYKVDQQFGKIFTVFAGLAIFITCLGLFGLTLFTSFQRAKEIAIRKVLGASVFSLLTLLIKDFVKLIILASAIAWVVSWWGLEQWLQGYSTRIGINFFFFAFATIIVLVIAFIIIGAQSWKINKNDPLIAIKQE